MVPLLFFACTLVFSLGPYIGFLIEDFFTAGPFRAHRPINFLTLLFNENLSNTKTNVLYLIMFFLGSIIVSFGFALFFSRKVLPNSLPISEWLPTKLRRPIRISFNEECYWRFWHFAGLFVSLCLILMLKCIPIKSDIFDFIALWSPLAIFVISLLLAIFFHCITTASEWAPHLKIRKETRVNYLISELIRLKEKYPANEFEKMLEEKLSDFDLLPKKA